MAHKILIKATLYQEMEISDEEYAKLIRERNVNDSTELDSFISTEKEWPSLEKFTDYTQYSYALE